MSRQIIVVGGFTTGNLALEPVAHAAIEAGLADDAETFTFPAAMKNPDRLGALVKGQLAITHSAGIMAVSHSMTPERLVACNGPEPRPPLGLAGAAIRKTAQHVKSAVSGPYRLEYARVMASNAAELALHPYGNLKHLRSISRFSTFSHLVLCRDKGILSSAVVTVGDVFYPYS